MTRMTDERLAEIEREWTATTWHGAVDVLELVQALKAEREAKMQSDLWHQERIDELEMAIKRVAATPRYDMKRSLLEPTIASRKFSDDGRHMDALSVIHAAKEALNND